MTTTTVPRAPAPARRSFLAAIGAAIAAPAAAALPAAAATAPPPAQEAPELLELGAELPRLRGAIEVATARRDEALATFERLRPAAPPEIIYRGQGYEPLALVERGPGGTVPSDGTDRALYVSRFVRAHVVRNEISRHTKEGKLLRRIGRLAAEYERGVKAALRASDFDARHVALHDAMVEVDELVDRILEVKPVTLAGVLIYAKAAACRGGRFDIADDTIEALLRVAAVSS